MAEETPAQDPGLDRGVAVRFREAWTHALAAVNAAQVEAGRVVQRVGELAGKRPDEARRLAKELGDRLAQQRREFERALDEGVVRTLARVKVPRRDEIDALGKRVGRLAERIDALAKRKQEEGR